MSPACSAPIGRWVGGFVTRGARRCTSAPVETCTVVHRTTGTRIALQLCARHARAVRRRKRAVEIVATL